MTVTRPPASGTSDAAASSRTRRRAYWVAAASLTLLAAVAVGVVLGRSSTSAANEPPPSTITAQSPADAPTTSGEWDTPTRAPSDLRWERVELPRMTTWVPISPSYGPATNELGEWGGWSQTPMGAVMAAHTIFTGWGLDNADAAAYAADHMQTFRDYVKQTLAERPADGLAPKGTIRPTGFRVDDYSVAEATVTLTSVGALPGSAETTSMLTLRLRWADGDWKVVHTPDGHPVWAQAPAGTFIPWGPQ